MSDAVGTEPHPFEVAGRRLAGLLTRPTGPPRGSVVVAHPHPGHGGHMDHGVVRTVAERAAAAGLVALRFDVGGVRTSVGDVHDRAAHLRELFAAIDVVERLAPGLPRYGAGFSYGARLWMEAVLRPEAPTVAGLLLLAPATRVPKSSRDFGDLLLGRPIRDAALDPRSLERLAAIPVPARILVGANDTVAPPDELRAHAAAIAPVVVIEGVNHFFSRAVGGGATAYDALVPALDAAWTDLVG